MARDLLRFHLDRKARTKGETDVVHPLSHLRAEIVDGSLDLEVLVRLVDNGIGVLKKLFRALVHRKAGPVEPALCLQVFGEILKEREEIILIFL